jgi:hypothetical protein
MTVQRDPDAILATWLEEGPTRLPDATRRSIAVSTATTHQARRPMWSPLRYRFMNTYAKLAIAAVIVVAVGAAGLALLGTGMSGLGGQLGPSPSPSPAVQASLSAAPTPLPSAASLPAGWTPFQSNQYGYDMGYLTGWTAKPAIQPWTYAADAKNWSSGLAQDEFLSPDVSVRMSAWTVPTEGATLDDRSQLGTWIATYCQRAAFTPCTGIPARAVPLCLERRDCHPGMLVPFNEATLAFFTGGIAPDGTVVVAAVWRPEPDPIVAPFGGAQHLLEAYLSTMSVWPESVPPADRVVRDVPGPTPSPS